MRPLGIGVDGDYLMALSKAEYEALRALTQAGEEAGEDLAGILRIVRAFLDARFLIDDMRLMVERFEAVAGDLPADDAPLAELDEAGLDKVDLPTKGKRTAGRPHPIDPHRGGLGGRVGY